MAGWWLPALRLDDCSRSLSLSPPSLSLSVCKCMCVIQVLSKSIVWLGEDRIQAEVRDGTLELGSMDD